MVDDELPTQHTPPAPSNRRTKILVPQPATFADNAPLVFDFTGTVAATPDEVWSVFVDNASWQAWFTDCTVCRDTSTPFDGIGSTRHIEVRGLVVDERFVSWDPGREWGFTATAMGRAFATSMNERARFSAVGVDRTRIDYRMAIAPRWWFRPIAGVVRIGARKAFAASFANLERYIAERRGVAST